MTTPHYLVQVDNIERPATPEEAAHIEELQATPPPAPIYD